MNQNSQPPKSSRLRPSRAKLRAWRALMEAHGHITPRLDEELRAHSDLDLKSYDALLHTYEAGLEGIRMANLAERVVVSKSGLTAIVDRLEQRGLVRRLPDHADRRATRISITETGVEVFRAAAEVHLDGIARHFAAHISNDEAKALAEVLERVREPPG